MKKKEKVFLAGVNLPPLKKVDPERRFEEGDQVPELTTEEAKALKDVIGEKE